MPTDKTQPILKFKVRETLQDSNTNCMGLIKICILQSCYDILTLKKEDKNWG